MIGDIIRKRRKELGLTLEEVGKATGVQKSAVLKWEKGRVKSFGVDKLYPLSNILQISIAELLGIHEINHANVCCKDCKFWYKDECSHLCKITGDLHPANWYCADAERREADG